MQERDLIDIVAITFNVDDQGTPTEECLPHWKRGLMHPKTRAEMLHCPPGMQMMDIPLQLEDIGENVRFGLYHILDRLTDKYWDQQRSLN